MSAGASGGARRRERCMLWVDRVVDTWLSRISLGTLGCGGAGGEEGRLETPSEALTVVSSPATTAGVPAEAAVEATTVQEAVSKGDEEATEDVTVVAVEFNDEREIGRMRELTASLGMRMWLIRKGRSCADLQAFNSTLYESLHDCSEHPNVGREQGSFLEFASARYDELPERLILTAIDIDKFRHSGRNVRRDVIVQSREYAQSSSSFPRGGGGGGKTNASFVCYTSHNLRRDKQLSVSVHGATRQARATPSPLSAWVDAHIGPGSWRQVKKLAVCLKGTFYTTRDNVRSRPREFYARLARQVNIDTNPEAGHFMERLDGVVFGGWHDEKRRAQARLLCATPPSKAVAAASPGLYDCAANSSGTNRRLRYGALVQRAAGFHDDDDQAPSDTAGLYIPGLLAAVLVLAALLRCWHAATLRRRSRSLRGL